MGLKGELLLAGELEERIDILKPIAKRNNVFADFITKDLIMLKKNNWQYNYVQGIYNTIHKIAKNLQKDIQAYETALNAIPEDYKINPFWDGFGYNNQ